LPYLRPPTWAVTKKKQNTFANRAERVRVGLARTRSTFFHRYVNRADGKLLQEAKFGQCQWLIQKKDLAARLQHPHHLGKGAAEITVFAEAMECSEGENAVELLILEWDAMKPWRPMACAAA
jgi:hypothetical protein